MDQSQPPAGASCEIAPQHHQVWRSLYNEQQRYRRMEHTINLAGFEQRLRGGEVRDGNSPQECLSFKLGDRDICLEVAVRHNGNGMDEEHLVKVTITNKTDDGMKVYLSAILQGTDPEGQTVYLASKDYAALERDKRLILFSFKATDVRNYCTFGNLRLKLQVSRQNTNFNCII